LWDAEYGEITKDKTLSRIEEPSGGSVRGGRRRFEDSIVNRLIDQRNFPIPISYFFFLRNPLLRRTDHANTNCYFLFEKNTESYIDLNEAFQLRGEDSFLRVAVSNGSDSKKYLTIWPYDCLNDNYKARYAEEEDFTDTYSARSRQVYSPQIFFKFFKIAVRLLEVKAIAKHKNNDETWENVLTGMLNQFNTKPLNKMGEDKIVILYDAFEKMLAPISDEAHPLWEYQYDSKICEHFRRYQQEKTKI